MVSALHLLCDGYSKDMDKKFKGSTKGKWWFAILAAALDGGFGLVVTFMLVVQSAQVVELLLNFTAIEFVAHFGTKYVPCCVVRDLMIFL